MRSGIRSQATESEAYVEELTYEQIEEFLGAANDPDAFGRGIEGLRTASSEEMAVLWGGARSFEQ